MVILAGQESESKKLFAFWPMSCRHPLYTFSDHPVFGLFIYNFCAEFIFPHLAHNSETKHTLMMLWL